MIEIQSEQPITLADAARRLPSSRRGKRVHVATLVRWIRFGVRGQKLEAIRIGASQMTSVEALQRFAAALTTGSRESKPIPADKPKADEQAVEARLRAKGLLATEKEKGGPNG